MAFRPAIPILPFLLAAACAAPAAPIDRLWADLEAEAGRSKPLADPDAARDAAIAARAERARSIADAGDLRTGRDHFRAAVVLVESNSPADWDLAANLGRKASEMGEPLGLRVAAEAIDKDLVHQGRPQRFGTQFVWDARNQKWRLYPMDPATTDTERAAMGVPTYAELIQAEVVTNARAGRKP
ncbi:MAG: hypothetical protein NTY35_05150 [Planctomycetota bacterium]|nr:hypothetical protein [Planctomycetota bacterium]